MTRDGDSAVRALTAGMVRGIGLFLMGVAILVSALTLAGLTLFILDGDSFSDRFSPSLFLVGIPTVAVIGGVGWVLWRFAASYDAPHE